MYRDFMDALDDQCKSIAPDFAKYCGPMYAAADAQVEMVLHDYSDEEICVRTKLCSATFYPLPAAGQVA